jgi:hypothetical protein
MRVRIRIKRGSKVSRSGKKNRHLALLAASLLTPAALVAALLAVWRLAADLNWANRFAIRSGPFSHWQVWIAAAGVLQLCSHALNRYARDRNRALG